MGFFKQLNKRRSAILCIVLGCVLLLAVFVHASRRKNAEWLQGEWSNASERYSIRSEVEDFSLWTIKQNGFLLMADAKITRNSTKDEIILTKSGSTTAYHLRKLEKTKLELRIVNGRKQVKKTTLHKEKQPAKSER